MLGLLTVFCMVAAGVYKKGMTKAPDADDPDWISKGGDESMKTVTPIPPDTLFPRQAIEQSGLGGQVEAEDPATSKNTNQRE